VTREFRLGELPARRKGENDVDDDRDALVLKQVEDTARFSRRAALVSVSDAGWDRGDSLMLSGYPSTRIPISLNVNTR
jgi:hypothetical protein